MGIYIVKSKKEFTGSHMQESSPISNWSKYCNLRGTINASTHQTYGGTNGNLSRFHWWLMTSRSNILEKNAEQLLHAIQEHYQF